MSRPNVPLHAKSVDDASSVVSAVDKSSRPPTAVRLARRLLRPVEFDLEQRNRLVLPPHTRLTADKQLSPN
jgi:hypothetical protein